LKRRDTFFQIQIRDYENKKIYLESQDIDIVVDVDVNQDMSHVYVHSMWRNDDHRSLLKMKMMRIEMFVVVDDLLIVCWMKRLNKRIPMYPEEIIIPMVSPPET